MTNLRVKTSLTKGPRLNIYVYECDKVLTREYDVHFVPPIQGTNLWRLRLIPMTGNKLGNRFSDPDGRGVFRLVKEFNEVPENERPEQYSVCDSPAQLFDDGSIIIHLPEKRPTYNMTKRRGTGSRSSKTSIGQLRTAIRTLNRCKEEMDGLHLAFNDDGKLTAKIVVTETMEI